MNPIPHSLPPVEEDDIEVVAAQLRSGHLEDGETVTEFERALADYTGRKYAVSTANGFGAIHLGLIALGISEGDEVIIPSYTCSALLNPVKLVSARPVIADIGNNGFNLTAETVREHLTDRTKAVIVPHTFGFPAGDIEEIGMLGIPVIEDCAQAVGGMKDERRLGSFGALSVFSFYASKMLCAGDGGMLLTDDENIHDTARRFRYYGGERGKTETALNYRYTNLNAALGLNQLKKLDTHISRRRTIAARYDRYFSDCPEVSIGFDGCEQSCYYRYPVAVDNRDAVKQALRENGIHAGYGVLENMHTLAGLPDSGYPRAAATAERTLSIPIYPSLDEEQISHIADKLIDITSTA